MVASSTQMMSKRRSPHMPMRIAPTPHLRAEIAISEAHTSLLNGIGQVGTAMLWMSMLSMNGLLASGNVGTIILCTLMACGIATTIWVTAKKLEEQRKSKPLFSSGYELKPFSPIWLVQKGQLVVLLLGILAVVGFFVFRNDQVVLPGFSMALYSSLAIFAFSGVFCDVLEAMGALAYARAEISQDRVQSKSDNFDTLSL